MKVRSRISTWAGICGIAILAAGALPVTAFAEQAVAPEKNPPGDIPDSQVFISYASPDGYEFQVPEGWARTVSGHKARFADKYGLIIVDEAPAAEAPTVDSAKTMLVPQLIKEGRAVEVTAVTGANLKGGKVVRIVYKSNSDPNPVTGRQLRQEHERFIFFRNGKTATLDLAAPVGADNVDQWQLISNSFRWN